MSNLVNGWYKCDKSNEKCDNGNWAWIEGKYYYFKDGYTMDEAGMQRPTGRHPLTTGFCDDCWLENHHLILAEWTNGCPVKLEDGRTGKITICEDEMIEVQLDNTYTIPSFVKITPNEFEVINPLPSFQQLVGQIRHFQRSGRYPWGSGDNPSFEIPEVGQLVRDKDDLSVWQVVEVYIDCLCCDITPHHYVELRCMEKPSDPYAPSLMRHETRFLDFWDHYEKWSDDMGFTGMFFTSDGRVQTVYKGCIQMPGFCNKSHRYKDLDEIRKYVDPNAIEVDATTYCKQDDPAKDWFTGYAICVYDGRDNPKDPWLYPITKGKIYRMEKGRFVNDKNALDDCAPEEFKKCFKPVNEIFA